MTNAELEQLLKSAPIPDRDAGYWEDFPQTVTHRLNQRWSSSFSLSPRHRVSFWFWALGLATAFILLGFAFGFWRGPDTAPEKAQRAAMQKYFAEISLLFPHQIKAIVVDHRNPRLLLADQPDLPNAQPIFLNICGPKGCQQVITFSGQQIQVNGEMCDVLLNAQGQVLVAGERWVWSSASAASAAPRYRIQACPLEAVL